MGAPLEGAGAGHRDAVAGTLTVLFAERDEHDGLVDDHGTPIRGRTVEWGTTLEVDHLDLYRANNTPANLVPVCRACNNRRRRIGVCKIGETPK